ncbi:PAS domain S-box protein [Rheinheimera baltica]|nr:PAS domain S-box protein [Rheinheimera baltica]MDP5142992.1 PAS domain S-box protein [Rheinheimera baltica]
MSLSDKEKLNELIAANNIATWEWHIPSGDTVFNNHWAEMVGYQLQELMPFSLTIWRNLLHPADLAKAEKALDEHFNAVTPFYDVEARMQHKQGHWVWVRMRGRVVQRDVEGKPILMFGTHCDITTDKQAKFAEQQHKHTYDLLIRTGDIANIGTWEVTMPPTSPRWDTVTRRIHQVEDDFNCDMARAIEFYQEGESRERIAKVFSAAVNEAVTFDEEFEIVTARDELRWVRTIGIPEFHDGECIRVYGLFQDITQVKTAYDSLQSLSSTLYNVMDAASEIAIIATDLEGVITLFNRGAELMLGYKADELVGKHTPMQFHDSDEVTLRAKELREEFQVPITGIDVFAYLPRRDGKESRRWIYRCKHGTELWVQLVVTPMYNAQKQLTGYLGMARDITLQEHISFELKQFFDLSQNLMCIISLQGYFERVNHAFTVILGYSEKDLLLTPYAELIHPQDIDETAEEIKRLYDGDKSLGFVNRLKHHDGHYVTLEWFTTPDPDTGKLYATAQDITERHRLELMKTEFVSTVSHELRTPLTAISGALGLVLSERLGPLSAPHQHLLKLASDNSQRLTFLINDLLDIEKLAAGKMRIKLQPHSVTALLAQAIAENQTYALEKQVIIENAAAAIDAALDAKLDRFRFLQVMANLLSNAIKFSPANGRVIVNAEVVDDAIRISVQDNGPGIAEDFKHRIFQKFSQADASDSRIEGGTGLGLALSKQLVEAMHGRIYFDSTPGQGACFYLTFSLLKSNT